MKPFAGSSSQQYRENIYHKRGLAVLVIVTTEDASGVFRGVVKSLWACFEPSPYDISTLADIGRNLFGLVCRRSNL
jgi:hypothetical protein